MKIQFFDQLIRGFNFRESLDIEFLQNLQGTLHSTHILDLEEAITEKP
jgi:hypothetical protein